MAIFEDKHYKQPISGKLSLYLITFTSRKDITKVCAKSGLDTDYINKVIRQRRNLTKNNSTSIVELIKVAIRNYDSYNKIAKDRYIVKIKNLVLNEDK